MTRQGRVGRIERTTKETSVLVEIDLDGTGRTEISTGSASTTTCSTSSAATVCST